MKMKQIAATDMQQALRAARDQLGEDAVLLDTKSAPGGKGIVVTFAIDERDPVSFEDDFGWDAPAAPHVQPFTPAIVRAATAKAEISHPAYAMVLDVLEHHAIPEPLRERLTNHLRATDFKAGALIDVAETALADALATSLVFKSIATNNALPPARALMLVGTHGAGKTSAIAKLATELTLHKQRVVILSCDNERMGAADTLAGLSQLLKCGFHVAEDRAALKPLLKDYQGQAWMLIDSTGVNIYEFTQLKSLGEIAGLQGVEPILTCPAGMDAGEAQEMSSVLGFLGIERMIATKVDATRRLTSLFTAITTGGLALANISSSAKPTQACSPASPAALARLMFRHVRERIA